MSVPSIEEAKEKVDAYETATSRVCCVCAPRDLGRTGNCNKIYLIILFIWVSFIAMLSFMFV